MEWTAMTLCQWGLQRREEVNMENMSKKLLCLVRQLLGN